ncbi:MAG: transporter substrate-binding domain-containing protein [Desulfosarcinaceae bacterium]
MRYAALFLILILAAPVSAVELTILTEEYPPFNYSQEGKITGVSTEVVQHVMAATGYEYTIKSLPWSEAYEKAQKEKNTLIYSISRRKKREPLFKWIGVLTPTTYSVKALASRKDIKIDKLEDMKKYKIGTNADDAVETWLLGKGFALSDLTRTKGSNSVVKNFRRLMNKEIDVWPAPDAVAFYIARQQGHSNPEAVLSTSFPLIELSGGYYIAGSLDTSETIISSVGSALEQFKKTDDYYKILSHWGLDAQGLKTDEPITKLIYLFKYLRPVKKVGYLASDKLAAHKEGGLYRKEMREEFIERYVKTFQQWQSEFLALQDQVDAIILGDVSAIDGWSETAVRSLIQRSTRIPTGYVLEDMSGFAMLGYEGNDLVLNKKIAQNAGITFTRGLLKKADRVIQ